MIHEEGREGGIVPVSDKKCSAENNELALAEGRKMTMDAQKVGRGQLGLFVFF